jgi:hypothetical protein
MKEVTRSCYTCQQQFMCGLHHSVKEAMWKWLAILTDDWQSVLHALGETCKQYRKEGE